MLVTFFIQYLPPDKQPNHTNTKNQDLLPKWTINIFTLYSYNNIFVWYCTTEVVVEHAKLKTLQPAIQKKEDYCRKTNIEKFNKKERENVEQRERENEFALFND